MNMKTIMLPADDANLQNVNDFIHSFLPDDCDGVILNQIDLAVEEIFVNIAHYAYDQKGGEASVTCGVEGNIITVSFEDSGKPFNPLEKKDPDLTLSAEERSIGGLGIFLTKKFMDKVDYKYENGKNRFSFSKKFTQN